MTVSLTGPEAPARVSGKRRGTAIALVVLAATISVGQALLAGFLTRLSGPSAVLGQAGPAPVMYLYAAISVAPVLVRHPVAFRLTVLVLATGSVLVVALAGAPLSPLGAASSSAILWLLLYAGFPRAVFLLLLAVVCCYGPRRMAESACLLGILITAVTMLVLLFQAARAGTVLFAG